MTRPMLFALALLLVAPAALAQKDDHPHDRRAESVVHHADVAGLPTGLSPSEVADLRDGRGMGLARAAELNHYPGPKHVLELADSLGLTAGQRAEADRLMQAVQTDARPLGEQIVAEERALDAVFADGRATPALVDAITSKIGALQGELRAVHLRAHVAMRDALTPEQVAAYDRLRNHTD